MLEANQKIVFLALYEVCEETLEHFLICHVRLSTGKRILLFYHQVHARYYILKID